MTPQQGQIRRTQPLPHCVRIIGGTWKRTPLKVLDRPGLRPTPERVRETLFNWLGQDLTGWKCVDAFAGSGALGFEAASRGAASVVLVEQDSTLGGALRRTQAQLQAAAVQVLRGDGVAVLRGVPAHSLDLVLLDPPFESDLFEPALSAAQSAVRRDGWVYLEAPRRWEEGAAASAGMRLHRYLKAGAVHAHLWQNNKTDPSA